MLNLLTYDQISNFWSLIKNAVEKSLPPIAEGNQEGRMNRILEGLLSGSAQCWVSYDIHEDGSRKFNGVMITTPAIDFLSGTKSLLLYCGYGYADFTQETWISGWKSLSQWAISRGFERVIAYTDVSDIVRAATMLGGEAKYTFISIPLRLNFEQSEEV